MDDLSFNSVDSMHHVQGLSNISNSVKRRKEKKGKDRNHTKDVDLDDNPDEELETEEKGFFADDDMDHVDFHA